MTIICFVTQTQIGIRNCFVVCDIAIQSRLQSRTVYLTLAVYGLHDNILGFPLGTTVIKTLPYIFRSNKMPGIPFAGKPKPTFVSQCLMVPRFLASCFFNGKNFPREICGRSSPGGWTTLAGVVKRPNEKKTSYVTTISEISVTRK